MDYIILGLDAKEKHGVDYESEQEADEIPEFPSSWEEIKALI